MKDLLNKIFSNNSTSKVSDNEYSQNIKIAIDAINKYWTNNKNATKGKGNDQLPEERIQKLAELILEDCVYILTQKNPFLENRQMLADSIIKFTKLQVLVLKPDPNEDATGMVGHLGITGKLNSKIVEAVKSDKELYTSFNSILKTFTYDTVYSQCLYEYRYTYSRMLVFSHLRVIFDDFNTEDDWLRSCIVSSCSYEEDVFREKLGMNSKEQQSLTYLRYSTYVNLVLNGEKDPKKKWNENNRDIESPDNI